jgi:hypothetical protein
MTAKSLKNILIESASVSTMHGLPNFVRTDRSLIRIIWAICFLAAFGICAYLIIESILDYLKFDVITTVKVIKEPYAEFPALMLCNKNNFNDNLYEQLLNESIINRSYLKSFNRRNLSNLTKELETLKIKIFAFISRANATSNFKVPFGQMLMSCRYGSEICKASDFRTYFHFTYGYCDALYSFINPASKSRKIVEREGITNGLQLELYVGESKNLEFLSSSVGFSLFLFNRSENLNRYDPIDLAPGFEYNIVVERTHVQQMPIPYSNCKVFQSSLDSFDSDLTREFYKNNLIYKQNSCIDLCYQIKAVEACNCTDFIFDKRNSSKICSQESELKCIDDFYYLTYIKNDFIENNCVPLCPQECENIRITPIVSASKYPSDKYFEIIRNNNKLKYYTFRNSNMTNVKESILKVNIYHQRLTYTMIKESATMTVVDLLANIGGT